MAEKLVTSTVVLAIVVIVFSLVFSAAVTHTKRYTIDTVNDQLETAARAIHESSVWFEIDETIDKTTSITDPWGTEIRILHQRTEHLIISIATSAGPDKTWQTHDDITNTIYGSKLCEPSNSSQESSQNEESSTPTQPQTSSN